jgi:hypothetical protein
MNQQKREMNRKQSNQIKIRKKGEIEIWTFITRSDPIADDRTKSFTRSLSEAETEFHKYCKQCYIMQNL